MQYFALTIRWLWLLVLLCSFALFAAVEQKPVTSTELSIKSVHIATGVWPGFTEPNERGAYFELIKMLFPDDMQFQVTYTAFNRTVKMVEEQQADMVLAVGLDICSLLHLSAQPFDVDQIAVLFKPARLNFETIQDLERYQLVTQRGYNYDLVLGIRAQSYEVDSVSTGINLVKTERTDAFLVEKTELDGQLRASELGDMQVRTLAGEPIYIGFANNERGAELKAWWDQQFQKHYQNGQLQIWYQRHPQMTLLPF